MASTTPSVTPRLRMTRHGPSASITATYDRSAQSGSLSEAGPSRLPEFSQLVDVDFDMSLDGNMYASDAPTDHLDAPIPAGRSSGTPTPKFTAGTLPMSTTPPTVTRSEKDKENPAAVLRALLSRLPPNRDNDEDMETPTRLNPMPNAIANDNERYPFEKDSDYEVETASATHSVAQSSLKDIFSKALREPGDTPRKDRSALANGSASRNRTAGRRRRSSIGASEVEETPRIAESMTLKGKRKSMSEDELEHLIRSPDKSKTRSRVLPQTLTKEFLRERFGSSSNSPTKPLAAADEFGQEISFPDLNSSRNTPPAATSTPQQSLWMSFGGDSNFQSNLLEQDSEMHKAIKAFGGSTETDTESDRSISPPPTLRGLNEKEKIHEATEISTSGNGEASTSAAAHRVPGTTSGSSPKSGSDMSITNGFGSHDRHDYNGGSLGEESMSLSLPAGHHKLHSELSHRSRSFNSMRGGSMTPLAHQKSSSSLRPHSPMPGQRSESPKPEEGVKERERNWNKPRKSLEMPSITHSHSHSHARSSPHPHLVRHDSNTSLRSMAASPTPSRSDSRASMSSLQSPPPGVTSPPREKRISFHSHARSPSHPSISHTPSRSPAHPHIRSRTTSVSSIASDDRSTGSVSPFSMGHHRRPSTPSDLDPEVVHERERNWNAPHPKWHDGMPFHGHTPKEKSLAVASPDARARANSLQHATPPHPHLHHSHSHSHARAQSPSYTPQSIRAISPQLARRSALSTTTPTPTPHGTPGINRSRSPLPTPPSRASSLKSIGNTYQSHTPSVKRHLTSPSVPITKKKAQVDVGSSVSTSGVSNSNAGLSTKNPSTRRTTAGAKSSRIPVPHGTPSGKSKNGKHLGEDMVESPKVERAVPVPFPQEPSNATTSPYVWPEIEEDQQSANEYIEETRADTHQQERQREREWGMETDDLHDTDFSQSENEQERPQEPESESENDTPRTMLVEPPPDSQDELSEPAATSTPFRPPSREHGRISPLPVANFDETVQNGVLSTDDELTSPPSPSPSTPPRQATPKLGRVEFATPSPPRNLPELPTPSSSDESLRTSPHRKPMVRTPKFDHGETNGAGIAVPFAAKTPKPPGGWLATPAPPVQPVQETQETEDESNTEGLSTSFDNGQIPMDVLDAFPDTPVNGPGDFTLRKTPKPPGGWLATPAPSKLNQQLNGTDPSSPEDDGQRRQLLTPVSSLSKASALNMKTPGVPGGWSATPGPATARKSVLKVRFDPQSPEVQDITESDEGVKEQEESRKKAKTAKTEMVAEVAQVDLPPSPRSPSRKSKSNIRILDAFGRESVKNPPPSDVTANKSVFRVLDALGREVKEEEIVKEETIVDQSKLESNGDAALPRGELLLKLRKGLVELVDDIADLDEGEDLSPEKRTRIRELLATSRQSRSTRQQLHAQSKTPIIPIHTTKTSFISWSPRTILLLMFLQAVACILLYRLCLGRARAQYMNYYDPFNPEVHFYIFKSDPTIHAARIGSLPKPSARALLPTGSVDWKHWFRHFEGLNGYIGKFWNTDIPRRRYLTPA